MGLVKDLLFRLRGEETVTDASKKAQSGVESLGDSVKKVVAGYLTWQAASSALRTVWEATNQLEASQRKLEATAKITGVSLATLQQTVQRGEGTFKLSTTLANDYAIELAKLATKAGDVGQATPLLESFLNIGAARGLSAADTLQAVQQAILGIDEGTDKLFGKNPSVIYAEYAAQIGTTAGKLTDQQKAQALVNEATETGLKIQGSYGKYLESNAGQAEQLSIALNRAATELGQSLSPVIKAVLPLLIGLANGIGMVVKGLQLAAVNVALVFEEIPATVAVVKGKTLTLMGELVQGASNFIPFFGDRVKALGDRLVAEGKRQVREAETYQDELARVRREAEEEILDGITESSRKQYEVTWKGQQQQTAAVEAGGTARVESTKKATKAQTQIVEDASAVIRAALLKMNPLELATAEGWDQIRTRANAAAQEIKISARDQQILADATGLTADGQERVRTTAEGVKKTFGQQLENVTGVGRAAIGLGQAMGVVSDQAAAALTSVIGMAEGIAQIAGGNAIGGIIQIVGALANAIAGIGRSETEKRRDAAFSANTQALDKLTREVGNLNLNTRGKTFAGVQGAVQTAIQARQEARNNGLGPGAADQAAYDAFIAALKEQGVGLAEARSLFKELFGRDMSAANKGTWFQDILAFGQGLQKTEFGQFGSDFSGQLDAMLKGFDIFGTTDADAKLAEFRDLVGKFSPALAKALNVDLTTPEGRAKAQENLRDLFNRLKNGTLSPTEIGVSGTEFLNLISTILPLLSEADGTGGPAATTVGNSMAQNSVGAALGLGSTTSTVTDLPQVTGTVVAPPPTSTTTVNGGINVTVNLPGVSGTREAAEELASAVNEILRRDYNRNVYATGAL